MRPGWSTASLGEIFEISRGGSPRPIESFITDQHDGLNWIKIGDASAGGKFIERTKEKIKPEGLSKTRFVVPGDFLLTNSMSFGRPYIMATSGCIHDGWLVLKPTLKERVHPDYFYYLLGSSELYAKFTSRAGGSTVKNLNSEIVASIEVSLPPFDEQRRIAAILDKADELRRKRKRMVRLAASIPQALFVHTFGNTETIATRWHKHVSLSDIVEISSGITKGRKQPTGPLRSVPYLAVANVQDHALDLSSVKSIDASEEEIKKLRLKNGDLVLTEGGDPDKLGRGTIWRDEIPEAIHQNHIFRVRPVDPAIGESYLMHLIGSRYGKGYFLKAAKQTTGIASINKTQLSEFSVPLPPIALQKQFTVELDRLANIKRRADQASSTMDALFVSLQHRAFTGQL